MRPRKNNHLLRRPSAQANAFVEALNIDPALHWNGGHPLNAGDVPAYLRELTPVVLRLDTRLTNHGFDGSRPTAMQSVLQAGTAVLVDDHGAPRARCYCGNPLTAPVALTSEPKPNGSAWRDYRPGALAEIHPSDATITNFVVFDLVTGQPFNRPAGTTGSADTPHAQPVAPPQPVPTTSPSQQAPQADIDGSYLFHFLGWSCVVVRETPDATWTITHNGNALTLGTDQGSFTGTLSADGSFSVPTIGGGTIKGAFTTEGPKTVIHGVTAAGNSNCTSDFVATKQ